MCPGASDVAPCVGIDAPGQPDLPRAERIARAVCDHWQQCTLFVIHADGAGDAERARAERVEPGLAAARSAAPGLLAAAGCVPVRETEAWMLVDRAVLAEIGARDPELPEEPESVADPKSTLAALMARARIQRPPARFFSFFGERLSLERLRTLPAFTAFERELETAVRMLVTGADPGKG